MLLQARHIKVLYVGLSCNSCLILLLSLRLFMRNRSGFGRFGSLFSWLELEDWSSGMESEFAAKVFFGSIGEPY